MAAKTMEIKTPSDVAAPPKNATVTASGLAYRVLKPGQGTVNPQPLIKSLFIIQAGPPMVKCLIVL